MNKLTPIYFLLLLTISFKVDVEAKSAIKKLINVTPVSFTTNAAGWYRVGGWTTGGKRGAVRIAVSLSGGSFTPQTVVIDAYKDWGSGLSLEVKGRNNNYISKVRIVQDVEFYIEIYIDRAITSNGELYQYEIEGYINGFVLNSGVLPLGSGTVFKESSGTLIVKNEALINNTATRGTASLKIDRGTEGRDVAAVSYGQNGNYGWHTGHLYNGGSPTPNFYISQNSKIKDGSGNLVHTPELTITTSGNIGVGTTDPKGYKLAVAGNIVAEEVNVKMEGNWPDYVFTPTYNLHTLEEVKQHIDEKGHLPNMPTAAEVAENGINLGEMNAKLLSKIEELTLYLLEQEKRLNKQEKEIELLKTKVE